jgi:2-oxoglutarate ferredoxin oxidoreductase subunit gamma
LLAGRLLAEAAVHDGLDVVQTNSYGPEARGGASRSEVVIGRGEIDVLHADEVDVLICLNQASCDAYYKSLAPRGLLITDGELVEVVPTTRAFEVPMTSLARKEVGTPMVANVIALAVLCAVSHVASREALEAAIRNRIPKAHLEANLKAIDVGFAAAAAILSRKSTKMRALWPDYGHLRGCPPDGAVRASADAASNGAV